MNPLQEAVRNLARDLSELRYRFAIIGGLAVGVRTEPRFTKDGDFAVVVENDAAAASLVRSLRARGYREFALLENVASGRISTVRLHAPGGGSEAIILDLLFDCCGIEAEIVAAADSLEIMPGVPTPVARTGHLIAMKLLARDAARRPQDQVDLVQLVAAAGPEDLALARAGIDLIIQRGFARGRDLGGGLKEILELVRPGDSPAT